MIVNDESELDTLFSYIQDRKTLIVPILADQNKHVSQNRVSCIYVYTEDDVERIVPIAHTEQITKLSEHLQRFLDLTGVFVYDKKQWLQIGGNDAVYDIKTLWWYTYNESYDETHYILQLINFIGDVILN